MEQPLRSLKLLEERWDCHGCGGCCRAHTVLLDPDDVARLESQDWPSHPEFAGVPVVRRVGLFGPLALHQRADGSCIFLTSAGRCRIHEIHGEAAKPWACRMYPFELIPRERSVTVTIRRNCPSAAANRGQLVEKQVDQIRPFVPYALPAGLSVPPPALAPGGTRDWDVCQPVLEGLEELLLLQDRPLVWRLLAASRLAELSGLPSLARRSGKEIRAVVPSLRTAAESGLTNVFQERRPPSRAAALLFRQSAAEYARFHPNLGDRPGLIARWGLLKAGWSFVRGTGDVPRIHPDLPRTTFSELERPLGNLAPEILRPLDDYFRANVASLRYCGAGHFGWSVRDGMRGLLLAASVSLWLLRWLSTGRAPATEDMIEVVRIVDRSHEYPLLAGWRHRRRLALLARDGSLEHLLAWYAR